MRKDIRYLAYPFPHLIIIRFRGLFKQVADRAAKDTAEPVQVFKPDGLCLVGHHPVKILVA